MSEFPGLPVDPTEPVPGRLRVLASAENLGTLHSVHRPASRLARFLFKQSRIYLFDQGFVLGQAGGLLSLFRWGQFTARKARGGYVVTGADGRALVLSKGWSGFAQLAQAITDGARRDQ